MQDVIITDTLDGLGTDSLHDYLAHAICLRGKCSFHFNDRPFELNEGDLMIVRKGKLIERLTPSDDFEVKVLYATSSFITLSTPQSNYGMKGSIALFLNPVMKLTREQRYRCEKDFKWIEYRLNQTEHDFYVEMLRNAVQAAILDFFDFHTKLYGEATISTQNAAIMGRFLELLENEAYRENREVTYFADRLCVTPKYLSEVKKKVSGYSANYWINRYAILDISRLLRDKSLTFVQISDMFGFSSPAYFSRYVQRYLGMNPTDYRE
ncbi:MAG: helix-turn-helix transcriptional regulator [Bacteroidales bacterium]|nr:helix-turn-helix transcriptional regulator [Bacteroidales bacterium]